MSLALYKKTVQTSVDIYQGGRMTADAKRSQGRLKIRWGRLSVAAIGALALVGAPVFLVLSAVTPMSW